MKVIILAGGVGTRLWPLSRGKYPKQFIKLDTMDKSILQLTLERCLRLVGLEDIILVTNSGYKHIIAGQIEEMGLIPIDENILLEPMAKNTLPAIYNGVKHIRKSGEDIVAVFPSDHLINDVDGFCTAVHKAESLAHSHIVTFGIPATAPETGYGYIQQGEPLGEGFEVASFKEKPALEVAQEYVRMKYFWNAGMFMFHTALFAEEVQRYCPDVYEAFKHDTTEECFKASPSISIDFGIMEHSKKVAVVPMENDWSDLGSFQAIYDVYSGLQDEDGNVTGSNGIAVDSHNSMILGNTDKPIALVGLDDVIVVDYDDATLVCRRDKSQRVKDVVEELKRINSPALDAFSTKQYPWGYEDILINQDNYKAKRMIIQSGKTMEEYRCEYCVGQLTVVSGKANVISGGSESTFSAGETLFIESGKAHAIHNPWDSLLEIIAVQVVVPK